MWEHLIGSESKTADDRTGLWLLDPTQLQVNFTALAWRWDPKLVCNHVLKTGIQSEDATLMLIISTNPQHYS